MAVGTVPEVASDGRASRGSRPADVPEPEVAFDPEAFRARIRELARPLWRDLAWRATHDPYLIWLSEVMLQQTQVARVEARWDAWLERFPTVDALAVASDADVLEEWQGMGYNRRALALHRAAQCVSDQHGGVFPREREALLALPGVGPSTAAGIRAFAFDEADVYLETNVRAVFIHELFPTAEAVPDKALVPLVRAACPASGDDVRGWYYALLDYGAWLKKNVPNPTRRSGAYARQSRFEGSLRQKRAEVVRILLGVRQSGVRLSTEEVAALLDEEELAHGRPAPGVDVARDILIRLNREGFCMETSDGWSIGS